MPLNDGTSDETNWRFINQPIERGENLRLRLLAQSDDVIEVNTAFVIQRNKQSAHTSAPEARLDEYLFRMSDEEIVDVTERRTRSRIGSVGEGAAESIEITPASVSGKSSLHILRQRSERARFGF